MAGTIFWDVDTQEDFISASGKLAVPGGDALRPQLQRLTTYAHDHGIPIVATADDHDVAHPEITSPEAADWSTTFPPHCMRATPGQRKVAETALRNTMVIEPVPLDAESVRHDVASHRGDFLLNKPGLDVFRWNPNAVTVLDALAPDRVVLYGVATDFCVVAAVEGIRRHRPQAELVVVRDAIASIDAPRGESLCTSWNDSGITVIDTATITG